MFRLGKTEAEFQELYRTQHGRVHRTLQGMTGNSSIAEELTQEAFLKAWKGLPLFGFRSSLKTWLFRVAINLGRDWLRGHRHHEVGLIDKESAEGMKSPETRAVQECLMLLEEDARTLLILHYYEGMDQNEIASVLKIPEGTVKSRLHTAKGKLRPMLLAKGFDV